MRLFLRVACAEGGGDGGRGVLQAPGGCVSFQTQLSFLVSNKHGKCAFGGGPWLQLLPVRQLPSL